MATLCAGKANIYQFYPEEDCTIETVELARYIVDLIADKKGENIVLLDIRKLTIIADYFVICSGTSERQLKAITETITEEVKKNQHVISHHVEGEASSGWVLIDYGSIIVHAFSPEIRDYYDLEGFWQEAAVLLKMQ
jgi:ribosome-associated protein